jgi:hypothetical protein
MAQSPERKSTHPLSQRFTNLFDGLSFSRLFGVGFQFKEGDSSPQRGDEEDDAIEDVAVIEYAKIVAKAKERVEIFSNELHESIYSSPTLQEAIQVAIKNGAIVETVVSAKVNPEILRLLISNGVIARGVHRVGLKNNAEVTVIDMKIIRFKHPEKGYTKKYDQSIMDYVGGAEKYSTDFRRLFERGIPITADNLTTWQNGLVAKKDAEKSGRVEVPVTRKHVQIVVEQ